MMRKVILAASLMFVSAWSLAQSCNRTNDDDGDFVQPWEICDDDFAKRKVPRFDEHPAAAVTAFKAVLPQRVDDDDAEESRRWLEAVHAAYNAGNARFAGHYLLVRRGGCGQGCHRAVIVDLQDGKVYRPADIAMVSAAVNNLPPTLCKKLQIDCEETFTVRKNSKLLVLVGALDDEAKQRGLYFYAWDNNKLKLLSKVERSRYAKKSK